MTDPGWLPKLVATGLIVCLAALGLPVSAAPAAAALRGTIVSAGDHLPLDGVRLHAGDPRTGRIYSSAPTGPDGNFSVQGLPAAGYELAVEAEGGLYMVRTPVNLAPGSTQQLTLAVNRDGEGDPSEDDEEEDDDDPAAAPPGKGIRGGSIWDNQFTAAGIVLGLAFVIGELIENATDDSDVIVSDPNP